MASATHLRSRRSAAQHFALAGVQREIRAQDSSNQRKYLREFSQAFRSYESVIDSQEFKAQVSAADVVLIGDYHALSASQRFAASLLEGRAQPGDRPVVLGLETIFARDQHILDEWWRREIDEEELRQRIRFDFDWGYDWTPFYELLVTAREHAEGIYGLDCMPREDLRKIGARDRHAAHKIGEIRQRHPNAVIMVLFGESHLAPGHLPRELRQQLKDERVLTVLQNVDALYWRAAGEQSNQVEAVRVRDDVVCVFNSTPLEKYENYRLHLSRWGRSEEEGPDLAPTIYNLVDSLLRFLGINRYASHNGTQPKFLVDLLPEVYGAASGARLSRLLMRKGASEEAITAMLRQVEERGCVYLARANAFYVGEFQMMYAGEEVARFLHHACRGLPQRNNGEHRRDMADRFYTRTVENALGYLGSRVLYPARPSATDGDHRQLLHVTPESERKKFDASSQLLGYMLGNAVYDAYLEGRVTTSMLRRVFLTRLEEPGKAREVYLELAGKVRRKKARGAGADS
ncbi:MAG: ChaN family lipoprotein [Acidobacteriia bacterium]|nr:ChaN family lipoprotein [Terriglobia bacterium]